MEECNHKQLKIMPDYKSSGIWCIKCGGIKPESIGLSQEIAERFKKWIEEYNSFLNWKDPGHFLSPSSIERRRLHEKEGLLLTEIVRNALGNKHEVFWWKEKEYNKIL